MMPVGVHIETPYNHISIVESNQADGRRVRILMTDPQGAQSLMYTDDPNELVSDYTKFYDLAFHFKPDTKNILMLGGGGYCVPRHVLAERPGVSFDVVELDPGITEAAQRYFSIPEDPHLRMFHEDARAFLNRAARDPERRDSYDAVFMDVFGSWYSIPFHLATGEAAPRRQEGQAQRLRRHGAEDGDGRSAEKRAQNRAIEADEEHLGQREADQLPPCRPQDPQDAHLPPTLAQGHRKHEGDDDDREDPHQENEPLDQAGYQVQAGRDRVDELLAEQGVDPPFIELSVEGACGLVRFFNRSCIMVSHHIEAESIHFVGIN